MTATSYDYEVVRAELRRIDHWAYEAYKLGLSLRQQRLSDALSHLLKVFLETHRQRDFLKPSSAAYYRKKLLDILHDCADTLRRLEDYINRVSGRNGLPPDLRASGDIQDAIIEHANDLLHFNLALVSGPRRRLDALPPTDPVPISSPPEQQLPSPGGAPLERRHSRRESRHEKDVPRKSPHLRSSSYAGGVPLPHLSVETATPRPGDDHAGPSSPFQPTVEEVPDDPPDEEKVSSVEEYHMTPPDSSEANSSGLHANVRMMNAETLSNRTGDSAPEVLPDESLPTSSQVSDKNGFLDPRSALKSNKGKGRASTLGDIGPSSGMDFNLYSDTDEESDIAPRKVAQQADIRVEGLSVANTPVDRTQMPPPMKPRGYSYTLTRPEPERGSSRTSPNYPPGHSPWIDARGYDTGRLMGGNGREKYSPQPSPQTVQQDYVSTGRPRAATQASRHGRRPKSEILLPVDLGSNFQSSDPRDIFREFLNTAPPGLRHDDSMHVHPGDSPKERPAAPRGFAPGLKPSDSMHVNPGDSPKASPSQAAKQRGGLQVTEQRLNVSLEDLYRGYTKKVTVTDREANLRKSIDVRVPPGAQAGDRLECTDIWFNSVSFAGDLHFIIHCKPHSDFTRHGDDLHMTVEIDLLESLCGWERWITTICEKRIRVSASEPTGPKWQQCFAGLGMPQSKRPDTRGDLVVEVNVQYPRMLSEKQKDALRSALRA